MSSSTPAQTRSASRRVLSHWLSGRGAEALIGFLLFYALPTLRAVEISFTDWNLLRQPQFVGWDNYVRLW